MGQEATVAGGSSGQGVVEKRARCVSTLWIIKGRRAEREGSLAVVEVVSRQGEEEEEAVLALVADQVISALKKELFRELMEFMGVC